MNRKLIGAVICTLLLVSCAEDKGHRSALLKYDMEIDGIIAQMTLEEKVNMLLWSFSGLHENQSIKIYN